MKDRGCRSPFKHKTLIHLAAGIQPQETIRNVASEEIHLEIILKYSNPVMFETWGEGAKALLQNICDSSLRPCRYFLLLSMDSLLVALEMSPWCSGVQKSWRHEDLTQKRHELNTRCVKICTNCTRHQGKSISFSRYGQRYIFCIAWWSVAASWPIGIENSVRSVLM